MSARVKDALLVPALAVLAVLGMTPASMWAVLS